METVIGNNNEHMDFNKLWTKIFSRTNTQNDELALHVSGATVRHRNPFENIEVTRNEFELNQDFIDKWVTPFYRSSLGRVDDDRILIFAKGAKEIDSNIVAKLLGDFNWRMRITGAFFAAINNYQEFEELIGNHLLKSEVTYAGSGYCIALAVFGNDKSKSFLKLYLEYYLDRKDLYFDQADAFCALEYIDKRMAESFKYKYDEFVKDKSSWNLNDSREHFADSIETIRKIQAKVRT